MCIRDRGDGQLRQGPRQQAHTEDGEEPDYQAVQALGAGDDLKDHHLAELGGILTQQAGARLAGQAGALCAADAAEYSRQSSPQQGQGQPANAAQESHALSILYHL